MTNKGWCEYCYLKDAKPCHECNACFNGSNFRAIKTNKPTNYDRIKNMSVEEMADMLARRNLSCMPFCKECETCNQHTFKYPFCASGIKKWLESEADNNA